MKSGQEFEAKTMEEHHFLTHSEETDVNQQSCFKLAHVCARTWVFTYMCVHAMFMQVEARGQPWVLSLRCHPTFIERAFLPGTFPVGYQ